MLTRLRVRGFKNLFDVEVRFGPFTCIAGKNGVGKSNLFDAIRFLHLLSTHSIMEAAQELRESKGRRPDPASLFTRVGNYQAPEIRFEADLIVDRRVEDDFGVKAVAARSTLRYSVAFELARANRMDRLVLKEESLEGVTKREAKKNLRFQTEKPFLDSAVVGKPGGGRRFISTRGSDDPEIRVHQEGHGGRKLPAPRSSRTVIGGMASSDFPTVLAVHREMATWRTLMLEPSAMRTPSLYSDDRRVDARGAHLPGAIQRLSLLPSKNGDVLADLANRLAMLLDDVMELRIQDDEPTETLTLEACGRDRVFHPARSLSDGTLRFLVLATLALDPEAIGVLTVEEPENGIHPERIPAMVALLRDIALDPTLPLGDDNPLRQVIVNTHSPKVVKNVDRSELVYMDQERVVKDGSAARVASLRVPPKSWRAGERTGPLARGHVQPYEPEPIQQNLFEIS